MSVLVRGDFDPASFSKKTGFEPSFVWRKGDPWPTNARLRPEDGWVVRFEAKRAWHLAEEMEVLLGFLESHPEIGTTVRKQGLEGTIQADIDIYAVEGVSGYPGMYFQSLVIDRIQKTGFVVDIDQIGVEP